MTRGLTDPVELPQQSSDLPSIAEIDDALQRLFEIIANQQIEIDTLKSIIGASIGTAPKPSRYLKEPHANE